MKLIINFCLIILGVICIDACAKPTIISETNTINTSLKKELNRIAAQMDSGEFVDSEKAIIKYLDKYGETLNDIDRYYLYVFEAEIMYYSALVEQGINSALKAKSIAVALKDSSLIGNTENFLGLFYLNKNFPDSAKIHFNNALKLLTAEDTTIWISRRFHVLNNLGELYLELEMPDSVIHYTKLSMNIVPTNHYQRALALGYWNIGEAFIQKKEPDKAIMNLDSGLIISKKHGIQDVSLFLIGSMMKAYALDEDEKEINEYLESGLALYNLPKVNSYAKTQFLESAIDALLIINDIRRSSSLQRELLKIKNEIRSTEERLKIDILNKYYENEKKFLLIKEEKSIQEIEIKQNRKISFGLAALLTLSVLLILVLRRNSIQKVKLQKISFEIEKEQLRVSQEKKEYKALIDAIEEERNRIAKELHDDIGSTLSSVSIYANVAAEEINRNPVRATELINKIKNQTTFIADNLSDLIWAIYSRNDTYGHLIQRMKNFSFEILSAKNIETNFQTDYHFHEVIAGLEIRKNVLMVFKESINNIAKYSQATKVFVTLAEADGQLILTIEDNGIGFNMETVEEGNGFTSLRARAKSIHGHLNFNSTIGRGTSLKLTFSDTQLTKKKS